MKSPAICPTASIPWKYKTQADPLEESQTIDSLMQVFRKHWSDNPAYSFGSRVEWVLSNTARTILANPGYTLRKSPSFCMIKPFGINWCAMSLILRCNTSGENIGN